jgi:hypothetical protein
MTQSKPPHFRVADRLKKVLRARRSFLKSERLRANLKTPYRISSGAHLAWLMWRNRTANESQVANSTTQSGLNGKAIPNHDHWIILERVLDFPAQLILRGNPEDSEDGFLIRLRKYRFCRIPRNGSIGVAHPLPEPHERLVGLPMRSANSCWTPPGSISATCYGFVSP